jgi:ribosomal protein S18 acetylase RimI-like enzyme
MMDLYAAEGLTPAAGAFEALEMLLADDTLGACFVISEDRRAVGYLVIGYSFSLEFGGCDAFLDELYLVPEARSRGIGKQAVVFAIHFCRNHGIRALHLEVSRRNAAAQRLYRGLGFRERHADYDLLTHRMDAS